MQMNRNLRQTMSVALSLNFESLIFLHRFCLLNRILRQGPTVWLLTVDNHRDEGNLLFFHPLSIRSLFVSLQFGIVHNVHNTAIKIGSYWKITRKSDITAWRAHRLLECSIYGVIGGNNAKLFNFSAGSHSINDSPKTA